MGGLARFDFIQGARHGFVGYFDNELYIHRTKLENADQFYATIRGLLQPPHQKMGLIFQTQRYDNKKSDGVAKLDTHRKCRGCDMRQRLSHDSESINLIREEVSHVNSKQKHYYAV